jgi:hypothetical protein
MLFHYEKKVGRETDFVVKWIHASVASHYNSDGSDCFCATVQSKINYMKIPQGLRLKSQHSN